MVANPQFINPFMDAAEIEVTGRDTGKLALGCRVLQPRRAGAPHP